MRGRTFATVVLVSYLFSMLQSPCAEVCTGVSRAVTDLQSEHRWVLSGTPIINGLQDAYGMFRFLKVRPWYDLKEFQVSASQTNASPC